MKKLTFYTLCIFLCLITQNLLTAQNTVSGVITDDNGIPISGANVIEKGTSNGTLSNFDGVYEIDVNSAATLVFSYVGYQTFETKVGTQTEINVKLTEGTSLNEIILVGT